MVRRVCVLMSGGLDSAALVGWYLGRGFLVQPVYVEAGLRWEGVEMRAARGFLAAIGSTRLATLRTLSLDSRDLLPAGHWSRGGAVPGPRTRDQAVYLPGRNLLLLSKAAVLCAEEGIGRIAIASLAGNPFPDARPAFFEAMGRAASLALGKPVRVEAPFRGRTKSDVVRASAGLPLRLTFSCIRPVGLRHCGACAKCAERRRSFKLAGVADPTRYAS
jgi:7-cyano-7-deazaguanine synthase